MVRDSRLRTHALSPQFAGILYLMRYIGMGRSQKEEKASCERHGAHLTQRGHHFPRKQVHRTQYLLDRQTAKRETADEVVGARLLQVRPELVAHRRRRTDEQPPALQLA